MMTWGDKIKAASAMAKVRFLGRQIPLFLSWPITNRCNYRCSYCDRPNQVDTEVSTERALEIVDEFAEMGTQFVFLSGGEPLVRKDAGLIIERCRQKRLFVCLTTNGALYLKRKPEIGRVDMLKISLDGPESVHDAYRAPGSFAEVTAVLADAREDRIPVVLNPVVSTASLPHIDEVIRIATEYGARIKFQPINHEPAGSKDIDTLMLDSAQMRALSERLAHLRRSSGAIVNSRAGIRYLAALPGGKDIRCFAGRLFAYLMPNGNIFPCNKREEMAAPSSCLARSVQDAMRDVPRVTCRTCWCTSDAELNLMMRFDPMEAIELAWRAVRAGV